MGFLSFEKYIKSILEVVIFLRDVDGEYVVYGVLSEVDKYVVKFIVK